MREFLRQTLTGLTITATMVWSVGLTAFVPVASAQVVSGSLIKASMAAVYYYGADGKRYVFPNEKTYFTWYADFSTVITITDAELASIAIGGNVTYRPGVKLVKIQTDPKVYAVSKGGVLHWVQTEAIAIALYGSNWNMQIDDIPDAFFAGNYTVGAPITQASDYNRAAELAAATSINADKNLTTGTTPPPATGSVSASLATDNPAGSTVPQAATGITVLKFNLSGTGTVTNLTFRDLGIGAGADVAAVYLYEGATRLTSAKTLNSSTKEVSFNLNWAISGTKTYSLVIDIAAAGTATTFGQHQFSLTGINAVPVTGVTGNTFTVGAEAVSTVTVDKTTTPVDPTVGATGAELANFKITGGVNDSTVNRITFTQTGSIDAVDLTNFVLKQGTTTVATAAAMSGDKIVLIFSTPFSLLSGAVKNFTLYADVAGRPGRTISIYVDEASDVNITDIKYGYPAAITNNFGSGTPATVTTQGGELTIAFNGPVSSDVSKGARDVSLFEFSMTASSPMTIKNSYVSIEGTAGSTQDVFTTAAGENAFSDIKIINKATGQVVAGPGSYTVASGINLTGDINLTDDFDVAAGTTQYAITADISSAAQYVGITYKVTFGKVGGVIFVGASDVKYQNSNDFVAASDIVPNAAIQGNSKTVRASSLNVALSASIADNTSVKGAADVQAVAYSLTAGSDSSVKITKFIVDPRCDAVCTNANEAISTAKLWKMNLDGSLSLLSGPKSVQGVTGSETITFDNFADTIAAGDSAVYVVSLTFSTTAVNNSVVHLQITAAASITAEDKDNNTVTAGGTFAVNGASTVTSTVITVGTFGISADTSDTTYKSRLVQMGTSNNKVLRLKARGTSEAFKVTDLALTDTAGNSNAVSLTITYPTDAAQTTMESKTVTFVGSSTSVTGMNWYVTKDTDSYATVVAQINTSSNGASSVQTTGADAITIVAEVADADLAAATPTTKVLGLSSGTYATDNTENIDATGNTVYARKTLITVTKDAASPSGTGFVPGVNEYLRFKIANSSGNTAVVTKLNFQVTSSDANNADVICDAPLAAAAGTGTFAPTITIYDVADQATDLVTAIAGADVSGCTGTDSDKVNYVVTFTGLNISPNSSRVFIVKADTTGLSSASDDSIRFDMTATTGAGDVADTATSAVASFVWNDGLNNLNGWKVEQLPVTGGNIQF